MLKKLILYSALLFAVPQSINANHYPLSPESKQFIVNSAIVGGIVGGGIGLIAACDKYSNEKHTKHASTWEKIKSFPWHYVILPALVGAAGAGFIASFHTNEEYLKSAEYELAALENDRLLNVAMSSSDAAELRRGALKQSFPSLAAYERLEALLDKIQKAKEYLFTVIKSGTSPLVSIAKAALEKLKAMEQRIGDALLKLKDSQYFQELATRNEIDFKNKMIENARRVAQAAESQAHAAHQVAHAALHHAHHVHHPVPVYVAPPPVNVYVRR